MSDLFRIGNSALLQAKRALGITGNNISNVGTDGYSRQRITLETRDPLQRGDAFIGQGSRFGGVERNSNEFINAQVRLFSGSFNRTEAENRYLSRLEQVVGTGANSVGSAIQRFFDATQELASNPAGIPERQALIGQADALVTQSKAIDRTLKELGSELNANIRASVDEVNQLANKIASLNGRLRDLTSASPGGAPNDLLDRRDLWLRELAGKMDIDVLPQADGAVDVFVGQGRSLIQGSAANKLSTQTIPGNSEQLQIIVDGVPPQALGTLSGGELQGLLGLRERVLEPNQSRLGLLLLNLTSAFNAQHQQGLDLGGMPGEAFFKSPLIQVESNNVNTGTAVLGIEVEDAQQLDTSRYRVSWDGSAWTMTRLRDGASVSNAALGALTLDGLTLDLASGAPSPGDSFEFNPGQDFIRGLAVAIDDPADIAAARLEFAGTPAQSNSGSIMLLAGDTTRPEDVAAAGSITLTFDQDGLPGPAPAMLVTWNGGSSVLSYDPNAAGEDGLALEIPELGLSLQVTGAPADGDSLAINSLQVGVGDNRNMLALSQLALEPLAGKGSRRLTEEYAAFVSGIGVSAAQSLRNRETESNLLLQAQDFRDSFSGVNLDEEFSDMLRFQQYYQASAQLIKVADTLFQSLISSI